MARLSPCSRRSSILLVLAGFDLPHVGDPEAPASTHVAARYVERAADDTRTPNLVTAVLADYRGFDTLGEAVVVFTRRPGLRLHPAGGRPGGAPRMTGRYESLVVDVVARLNVPFMQLFALYVIVHGHYSPGGGFQGGVILAVSVILHRLVLGPEESRRRFSPRAALALAVGGVLAFLAIGLIPLLLPAPASSTTRPCPCRAWSPPPRRYFGILLVEIAIGLGVWGALVTVYDTLARPGDRRMRHVIGDYPVRGGRAPAGHRPLRHDRQAAPAPEGDRAQHLPDGRLSVLHSRRRQAGGHGAGAGCARSRRRRLRESAPARHRPHRHRRRVWR
jgi:multicomponent Na+:H+ antiporter subunit B